MTRFILFTLIAALALAGPLRADPTLALKDLPAMVQSGTSLPVQVDVQGATPGQLLTVTAWIGNKQAYTMEKTLEAPGEALSLSISLQELPAAEDLWLQVQCGAARTAPRKVRLIPVPPFGDLGMEDKYLPVPNGKKWKSEPSSSSSSSTSTPRRLVSLPDDALEKVAGYTGANALRYLSKGLNRIAETATRELTIHGEIDDQDLLALVRKHPFVETIAFGFTPHLSPKGILAALTPCRHLRTLVVNSNKLTFPHIKEIIDRNERLVGLRIKEGLVMRNSRTLVEKLTDAELALLPERMEELEFESDDVRDETIHRFSRLRKLTLSNNETSFHGNDLPASLTSLRIEECVGFTGQRLPAGLLELHVQTAPLATDLGFLPNLRALTILDPPLDHEAAVATLLRNAPLLTRVELDTYSPTLIAALPAGLTELRLRDTSLPNDLPSMPFARFTQLEHLLVASSSTFSGTHLPKSLRSLEVSGCPELRAEALWSLNLTRLNVDECDGFIFTGLPTTLRELWVEECPKATAPLFLAALMDLPKLEHMTLTDNEARPIDVAPLLAHPTLQSLSGANHGVAFHVWERPGTGH